MVSSGPLPPPEILERYNLIVPGAADRIIGMAEREAKHLQDYEMVRLHSTFEERRRGQLFGMIVGLATLSLAGVALFLGHEHAAEILGGSTVVGLAGVFVFGRVWRQPKQPPAPDKRVSTSP